MLGTLAGPYTDWTLFDNNRKYGTVQSLPFGEADELIMAVPYNGQTGKGNQRQLVDSHVRKLKREMLAGNFTPTVISANLAERHRGKLTLDSESKTFSLEVDSQDPLEHTDGGHRFAALKVLLDELEAKIKKLKKPSDADEREKLARWVEQIKKLPITVTVYFDGNPQRDFVNLQLGRAVDSAHMLSLTVRQKMEADPSVKVAFEAARSLNKKDGSPFASLIRFDSRTKAPFPLSTLCATGASDVATSLVGLARVGEAVELTSPDRLAGMVVGVFKALSEADPDGEEILSQGKVLTPFSNGGTKGAATMMVGLGACLAYRVGSDGRFDATDEDYQALYTAAESTLDKEVKGNFSGAAKRKLLGEFAVSFFADVECEKHYGVPLGLVKVIPPGAFGLPPLPKPPPPPKVEKPKKKSRLPDVSGPATVAAPAAALGV